MTVANADYSQSACVLVWVLGHGSRFYIDTAKGTRPMLISHILSIFTKTKALSGKPKIFIFEVNFTEEITLTHVLKIKSQKHLLFNSIYCNCSYNAIKSKLLHRWYSNETIIHTVTQKNNSTNKY